VWPSAQKSTQLRSFSSDALKPLHPIHPCLGGALLPGENAGASHTLLQQEMDFVKTYIVYEVLWTRCEYGGPSFAQGATLHLTQEAALQHKQQREGAYDRQSLAWSDDPFYYIGSNPTAKAVSKSEYKRIQQQTLNEARHE
jgi:hypothetical protein